MPLYEYECDSCGYTCTRLCKYTERDRDPPMCQHGEAFHPATHAMRRLVSSGTGIDLKGEGWAKDGYAKH